MSKMNAREKFLIVLLLALVILLGGYKFLIEPEIKRYTETAANYAAAQNDQATASNNAQDVQVINQNNSKLKAEISGKLPPFFPELNQEKTYLFFYELAAAAQVSFKTFTADAPVAAEVTNPEAENDSLDYPAKAIAGALDQTINGTSSASGVSKTGGTPAPASSGAAADAIEKMTVHMELEFVNAAEYDKAVAFADAIDLSGRMVRITSYDAVQDKDGKITVKIQAECYGIKKYVGDDYSRDTMPAPAGRTNPFQ